MRVSIDELRKMVREEYLRTVPEFVLREEVRKMSDAMRRHLEKHVSLTKNDSVSQREDMEWANQVLKEMQDEVFSVVEKHMWKFLQRT